MKEFSARVLVGDKSFVAENGYLGVVGFGSALILEVATTSPAILAVTIDGQRNVARRVSAEERKAKQLAKDAKRNGTALQVKKELETATHTYRQTVPVVNRNNFACTQFSDNKIILLEWEERSGHLRLIEVSVTGQYGHFFLSEQAVYNVQAFRLGNRLTIPELPKLPELARFAQENLCKDVLKLQSAEDFKEAPEINADGLERNQARVKYWNKASNNGLLVSAEGQMKIHFTQVATREGHAYLEKGEVVSYRFRKLKDASENGFAKHQSLLDYEAIGVVPDNADPKAPEPKYINTIVDGAVTEARPFINIDELTGGSLRA